MKNAVIADKHHSGTVEVGTTVIVSKKGSKTDQQFTLVGSEETDSVAGKISNESPLGKALLGKKKGDEVIAITPKGEVKYTISAIA